MTHKFNVLALAVGMSLTAFTGIAAETEKVHQGYSATAAQYEVNGRVISNVDTEAKLWNPREKSEEELNKRGTFLGNAYELARSDEQNKQANVSKEKFKDALYINSVMIGTVGMVWMPEVDFTKGIARNNDAGASAVSVTAFAYPGDGEIDLIERLDRSLKVINANDDFVLIDGVESIKKAQKDGKIAVIFNTQGVNWATDDFSMIDKAYDRGVRVTNFTYNNDNAFSGGGSKQSSGVTELGEKYIKKANKLGIVMDCSHSSNQACIDISKLSNKPVIASHSNPDKLHNMPRNISDEAMKAIASTDGAVCSVGAGLFMNKAGDSSPEQLVNQIVYTANLIGKEHTCYATDFMHNAGDFFLKGVRQYEVFPPEDGFGTPATNIATEHVWSIVSILQNDHGWTNKEIRGFLGENLLRVYTANWGK